MCICICINCMNCYLNYYLLLFVLVLWSMLEVRRGDDTVGNPHRAQTSQFELFELVLLIRLDNQLTVEQFEAIVSQSAASSPLLKRDLESGSRANGILSLICEHNNYGNTTYVSLFI